MKMTKVKLGDILEAKRGTSLSGEYYDTKGKYIRLTLGNFNYPGGGFKENNIKKDIYFTGPIKKEFILHKGDIITPLTEQVAGLLGETARIPESDKFIQSADVALLIPNEKYLDKDYMYYLISSSGIKKQLSAAAQQTKIRHTSPDKIKLCETWIPPLEFQKKAAGLLKAIDDMIANNMAIILETTSITKTLYDYWFMQFDFPDENGKPYKSSGGKMIWNAALKKEIPYNWQVVPLKECIQHITTGLNPRKNFVLGHGDIKYITVKNLTANGTISWDSYDVIDEKARKLIHNRSEVGAGDILFASIEPLGRCYLVKENPQDWAINESIFSIRPDPNKITAEYLYMLFRSEAFVRQAENSSTGSVFNGIRMNVLEKLPVLLPDVKTLETFSRIVANTTDMAYCLEKEIEELIDLRNFLLPLLMNGQVTFKEKEA